jgi:3-dehydroquinate dehydratase / shikimate dehydrogenase
MEHALLCETVTEATMTELVAARDAAVAADLVELRLDGVADVDVARALDGRRVPVIVTCRPVWEGGQFAGSEEERQRVLGEALERGAEYVDVEWRAKFNSLIRTDPSRVVLSSHDFDGVPDDLCARVRDMRATGAGFMKIAIRARRLSDALPLVAIGKAGRAVVIAMGDAGFPTRLLASHFGSRWTYGGRGVAPGQIPVADMVSRFRFRTIGADTALYGVTGERAVRSPLPDAINAAFAAAGLDAVCVPLCPADAADLRTFTDAFGFAGLVEDGRSQAETTQLLEAWTRQRIR